MKLLICVVILTVIQLTICSESSADRKPVGRITGGSFVDVAQRKIYNFMVRLRTPKVNNPGRVSTCAGSLIAKNWILTAGHCLLGATNKAVQTKVLIGTIDLSQNPDQTRIVEAVDFFIHPKWDPNHNTFDDIALIRLAKPVELTDNIGIISLPNSPCVDYHGKPAIVAGWGRSDNIGTKDDMLKQVTLRVATKDECSNAWKSINVNYEKLLCSIGVKTEGACTGDSGGPMFVLDPKTSKKTILGITSFGSDSCETVLPRFLSCVYYHKDWIRNVTGIV